MVLAHDTDSGIVGKISRCVDRTALSAISLDKLLFLENIYRVREMSYQGCDNTVHYGTVLQVCKTMFLNDRHEYRHSNSLFQQQGCTMIGLQNRF